MTSVQPSVALSREELAELEALLDSERFGGEAMPLDALQGLFFAAAMAPEPLEPADWIPAVFGESPGLDDSDDARRALALAMRLGEQVAQAAAGDVYDLILYQTEDGTVDHASWCEGFLIGVEISPVDWYEAADQDEVDELLDPIYVLAGAVEEEYRRAVGAAEWERLARSYAQTLPESLARIRAYQDIVRSPPQTIRRAVPKVGRNDSCPCGSGKKYKQCCGAAGTPQ